MKTSKLLGLVVQFAFLSLIGCTSLSAQMESRDFADSTCPQKNADLKSQIIQARQCSVDSDCSLNARILSCYFTPCYGHPVNKNADIKELEEQLVEYEKSCVEPLMCACPPKDESPQCLSGLCTYPTR